MPLRHVKDMAKAVSTLVSITLLVAVDRAAQYWHHAHPRAAADEATSRRVQMDAAAVTPAAQLPPTNITSESNAVLILEEP